MVDAAPHRFRWRRELPLMLLPLLLTLGVRLGVAHHAARFESADTAIVGLMIRHIWTGERRPAFYYGQDYIGSAEAFIAAPWHALFPGDPRAFAISQALLAALMILPLYRLLFDIGGRAGALVGSLALALGTSWLNLLTAGELMGYLATLWLGLLLLLLGPAALRQPTLWRRFAVGVVLGLGLWTHPLILVFAGPVAIAAWARGRVCRLRSAGELGRALSPRWLRWSIGLGMTGLALLVAGTALVSAFGPLRVRVLGVRFSMSRPAQYLVRNLALTCAGVVALELYLSDRRRRWLALAGALVAGIALGAAPLIAERMDPGRYAVRAPTGLSLSTVPRRLRPLAELAELMLIGEDRPLAARNGEPWRGLYRALRALLSVIVWLGLAAVLWARRSDAWRLLTLQEMEVLAPESLLLLQGLLMAVLFLVHAGLPQVRYFLPLWIPFAGLLAWIAGRLARWRTGLAWLLGAIVCGYYGIGVGHLIGRVLPSRPDPDVALIASLERRQVWRGFASYWWAYRISHRSNERMLVTLPPDTVTGHHAPGANRLPWYIPRVLGQVRPFIAFCAEPPCAELDRRGEAWFVRHLGPRIIERWRSGPYRVYRFEFREPRRWPEDAAD